MQIPQSKLTLHAGSINGAWTTREKVGLGSSPAPRTVELVMDGSTRLVDGVALDRTYHLELVTFDGWQWTYKSVDGKYLHIHRD